MFATISLHYQKTNNMSKLMYSKHIYNSSLMIKRLSFLMFFAMGYIVAMAQGSSTNVGQPNTLIPLSTDPGVNTDDALNKLEFYVKSNTLSTGQTHYTCDVRIKSSATGEVTVPAKVTNTSNYVFDVVQVQRFGNAKITKVTLPEDGKISEIYDQSFEGCTSLTSVKIPKSITSLGNSVFGRCTSLTDISVAGSNFKVNDDNGKKTLTSYDGKTLYYYFATNPGEDYTISSDVTTIVKGAFTDNPYIVDITIPSSVTTINFPAFYRNTAQTTFVVDDNNPNYSSNDGVLADKSGNTILTFPYLHGVNNNVQTYTTPIGVTKIGDFAFEYCQQLSSIALSEGVTTLGENAFSSCIGMQTVNLPASLTTMGKDPFYRCNTLKEINVTDGNPDYASIDGVLTDKDKKTLIRYPLGKGYVTKQGIAEYKIPDGIEKIDGSAFSEVAIHDIVLPTSISDIAEGAFSGCGSLRTVTFNTPSNLTEIKQSVFQNCTALTSITIPSGIAKIDQLAFYNSGLTNVTIDGATLTEIGDLAFGNCSDLKSFTFSDTSCPLTTIGVGAFQNDTKLGSFTFPKTVTSINENAFSYCTGMETITFPDDAKISNLGQYVFNHCNNLKDVKIPNSVTKIGNLAFSHCTYLNKIIIPAGTTSIGTQAFEYCESLDSIIVDKNNSIFADLDGMLTTKTATGTNKKEVLYIMPPGRASSEYTLLPTITEIGSQAFYQNPNLTNIAIPWSVKKIDNSAFAGCNNLKSITLMGDELPSLPDNNEDAFSGLPSTGVTLYYRKKVENDLNTDSKWSAAKSKFSNFVPSFNAYYSDAENGRPGNANDYVEYLPLSNSSVAVVDNASVDGTNPTSNKTTLIIPEKIGQYTVRTVYDNAFVKNKNLKVLTFLGPISYIGVNAFYANSTSPSTATDDNTSTYTNDAEGIYFVKDLSENETLVFSQHKYELDDKKDFNAFADGQKIYVNPNLKAKFDTGLKAAKQTDSKGNELTVLTNIPYTGGTAYNPFGDKLSTLCREFAVQFDTNDFMPYAEVPSSYAVRKNEEGYNAIVKANSINNGVVPAFQAVIVKKKTTDDNKLYYQIADDQTSVASSTNTELIGLYEDTQVSASTTSADGTVNRFFGMKANGIFYPMSKDGTVKAFRSYLSLTFPSESAAKNPKISMLLSDGAATGIEQIENVELNADSPVYDLSGRKVAESWSKAKGSLQAGIYIVNGKKLFVK